MDRLHLHRLHRTLIQGAVTVLTNAYLDGFLTGRLYRGPFKQLCVPGLNCYSCPGALGSCPIGAMQALASSPSYTVSVLVMGFLLVVGGLIGRLVCGFLCPFGLVQDLLHKIPFPKKFSTRRLRPLTWLKYAILVVFVLFLPNLPVNFMGMGEPAFCKYLCPQGILEGALPLAVVSETTREALGILFRWKFAILLSVVMLSVVIYRLFANISVRSEPFMERPTISRSIGSALRQRPACAAASVPPFAKWTVTRPGIQTTASASAAATASRSVPLPP